MINNQNENLVLRIEVETQEDCEKLIAYYRASQFKELIGSSILEVRIAPSSQQTSSVIVSGAVSPREQLVSLSQCVQRNFTTAIASGWNLIKEILEPPQAVFRYRGSFRSPDGKDDEYIRLQAAQKQVKIDPKNSTAISTLVEMVRATQNEEVRWGAVESLAQFAPDYLPDGGIGLTKELRLANHPLKLSVSAIKITDEEVSVFLRLYPADNQITLPKGIKLAVLDEAGEIFDEVPSDDDEYKIIQYKVIYNLGDKFSVKARLASDSITESFVV